MRLGRFSIVALFTLLVITASAQCIRAQTANSNGDYATERDKAIDLMAHHKELEALPLLEDLLQKNPKDFVVLEKLADALLHHAATLSDQGAGGEDRIRAKELINTAIQLGDHSQLAENLADVMKNQSADGVLKFADKADVDAAMKAGEAAFAKGDFDEAIKNYSHALELDPTSYGAALFVGDSYFAAKQFPQAGEWYVRASQIDPNRETAYRYHADMLTKQGDFDGARTLSLDAIVAEPYNPITWRALVAWSNASKVPLHRVRVEPGGNAKPTSDSQISITLDPNQPADSQSVWLGYSMERALWQEDKFKKEFPKETQYRHSLAEEAGALTSAAKVAEELEGKAEHDAIAKDANIQLLLRLYHANMIDPYVLLNAADRGISQDYEAYRAANRAKQAKYLGDFVAPQPAKK
jgi:tetratricopeptide (TPR) repeat protein